MDISTFVNRFEKLKTPESRFDYCVSSIANSSPDLKDNILGKIVNLYSHKFDAKRRNQCKSLLLKSLSDSDSEIRGWSPLGIMKWGFKNLELQLSNAYEIENHPMVKINIYRALGAMSEYIELPNELVVLIRDHLLEKEFHVGEFVDQRIRSLHLLEFMGYQGLEILFTLLLDVDRWPLLFYDQEDIIGYEEYNEGILGKIYPKLDDVDKVRVENTLIKMATIY